MVASDTYSSQNYIVGWVRILTTNRNLHLVEWIFDLFTQHRIFIEIDDVWFGLIKLGFLCWLGLFKLLIFGHWVISKQLAVISQFRFSFVEFLQCHFIHIFDVQTHFADLFHELLQFFIFFCELSDNSIGFRLVYNSFVLNFLGLISISQCRKCLVVIVGCWRYGTNHKGFWVTSKRILENTCQTGVSVGNHGVLSFPHCLVGQAGNNQT